MAHGEGEATFVVDGFEFDFDFLAHFEGVFDFGEALVGDVADVEHAVDAGHDVDESAEILDVDDFAGVDFTDFWFFDEGLDPI